MGKIFVVLSAVVAATYAEADAGLLGLGLYGYGHAGYVGYGLKSAPCVNAANVPVPCTGHYIGKREAEAAPEADAGYLGYLGGYYGGYPGYFGGYGHYIGKREAEAAPEADAGYLGYLGGYY